MNAETLTDWLTNSIFTDLSEPAQIILTILATFVSEDATLLALALLVKIEAVAPIVYWLGGFVGILLGDLLLYYMGRLIVKDREKFLWIDLVRLREKADLHGKSIFAGLVASQFLPGSRFPAYVAAGVSGYSLALFVCAKSIVIPVWLVLFSVLGEVLIMFLRNNFWITLGFIALIVFAYLKHKKFNQTYSILSLKTRLRMMLYRLRRYGQFEFWPPKLFYIPVVFFIIFFTLKHRRIGIASASNPGIEYGGWVGEDKSDVSALIPRTHPSYLRFGHIPRGTADKADALTQILVQENLEYPFIMKPQNGMRGYGVKLIRSEQQARDYLQSANYDVFVQEYCPFKEEAGVFYVRYPGAEKSQIFSITDKEFPQLIGDGKNTLAELILADKRARLISTVYFSRFMDQLGHIPSKDQVITLVEAGAHSQGTIFLDGMDKIYRPDFHKAIDELVSHMEGFYIGRFDVRYSSLEDFRAGQNFKIIEINGAGGEATHIYDPKVNLFEAYKVLYQQYKMIYEIGAQNAARGTHVPSGLSLLRTWWHYLKQSKTYGFGS